MNYSILPLEKDLSYKQIIKSKFAWTDFSQLHIDDFCGWTIDYESYLILMKLLDAIKPKAILELGFGFSSLLIGQYAKSFNAIHDICENDPEWVKYFLEKYCISQRFNIILKDITYVKIQDFEKCRVYDAFVDSLHEKYDFILIDGPHGCDGMSRANLYQNIDILDKKSILMIHDTNRQGEKTLVNSLLSLLPNYTSIEFTKCTILSPKQTVLSDILSLTQKSKSI